MDWSENEIEIIRKAYEEDGLSIKTIATELVHHRFSTVSNLIKEKGFVKKIIKKRKLTDVQIQEICKLYDAKRYTQTILAKKYGCTTYIINKVLKENNIKTIRPLNRKDFDLKDDYFNTIDTEAKAYILGFIFADGGVYKNMLSIEIHKKDQELLEFIKKELNSINKISYRARENTEMVCLRICSKKICQDLAKYGIVPNKTQTTKHLPKIPEYLLSHFLRGLVDGDGWISTTPNGYHKIGFVSNYKSICEEFQKYCNSLIIDKNNSAITIKDKNSGYVSQFQKQSSVKQLATVLYKDSNCGLSRKYLKAEQIFKN